MREITELKEIQEIELGVLKFIDKICREHDIKYSLCFGTLLGAIRHAGFIPWDDDIDILMTRDEYNKFCTIMKNEVGRYQLLCLENAEIYDAPLAKVIDSDTLLIEYLCEDRPYEFGVLVEIFVFDKLPNNVFSRKIQYMLVKILLKILYAGEFRLSAIKEIKKESFIKRVSRCMIKAVNNMFGQRYIAMLIRWIGVFFGGKTGYNYVGNMQLLSWDISYYFPKVWFDEYIETDFCGLNMMIIKEYDNFLQHVYGDYWILPPVEKRVSHHAYKVYWKDNTNSEEKP